MTEQPLYVRLRDALWKLNPFDDACWQADGKPNLDALIHIMGSGEDIDHAMIDDARPGWTREKRLALAPKHSTELKGDVLVCTETIGFDLRDYDLTKYKTDANGKKYMHPSMRAYLNSLQSKGSN